MEEHKAGSLGNSILFKACSVFPPVRRLGSTSNATADVSSCGAQAKADWFITDASCVCRFCETFGKCEVAVN